MSYVVSARKYRPQVFDELIGQEHIANTLKNAIARERVGHAYLFSGPRGVGKTSAARIFAKALNCESGPTPTPCNSCVFCTEINQGRALDLVEIDGASNRRIDEVRQLRENVRFSPSSARYKIYIIDEVHMLTNEAFNALLKTLEEPPHHVVFIFATTEVNKVPSTIRSRCQQFVFKRVPISLVIPLLERILKDFSVEAEKKALFWIAKAASGSVRDAQSILDQMISYSEGRIEEKDVFYVLGLPGYDIYHSFAEGLADGDAKGCVALLHRLIGDGFEPITLISGLIEYFRNMNVLSFDTGAPELIDLPGEETERMKKVLGNYSPLDIKNILTLLSRTYLDMRNSELDRELLEIALLKLVHYREIINPAALVKRLEEVGRAINKNGNGKPDGSSSRNGEMGPQSGTTGHGNSSPSNGDNASQPEYEKPSGSSLFNEVSGGGCSELPESSIFEGEEVAQTGFEGKTDEEIANRVVMHFYKKRRAIAEFLDRAHHYHYEDNLLTIHYDGKQRLSYEHVSEDPTRRYIEKEVRDFLQKDTRVSFTIDEAENREGEKNRLSPGISKVLEIFKGEIVSKNTTGG
jgi:DNA polymerase-3 subunit gamma/tau